MGLSVNDKHQHILPAADIDAKGGNAFSFSHPISPRTLVSQVLGGTDNGNGTNTNRLEDWIPNLQEGQTIFILLMTFLTLFVILLGGVTAMVICCCRGRDYGNPLCSPWSCMLCSVTPCPRFPGGTAEAARDVQTGANIPLEDRRNPRALEDGNGAHWRNNL